MMKPVCLGLWLLLPAPLAAHPHIFVDTGLALEVDDAGMLRAVEITWAYDDFYSLLIFEDLALDADLDGQLTEAELQRLQGFDLNWSPGFAGDLYVSAGAQGLGLGAPQHLSTEVVDGVITTRHRRVLTAAAPVPAAAAPVPAAGVTLRAYDPTYYTAYEVSGGVTVSGPCTATVTAPDLDRAYTLVEELLYAMPADQAEDAYPEVGRAFATTVMLECDA
ncbi:MAG: polyphosphate kinase [Alphaproteobacteria bacterium MedPE-SWcel]|nr:MAG: polyphosphate kinase [Alphaproteobacteria bacterium MedPE-SWcel]